MRSVSTTVSSRVLGRRLRAMRDAAGLTSGEVAATMEYSRPKLSRQEGGTHAIAPHELSHMVVQLYGPRIERYTKDPGELQRVLAEMEALRQRAEMGKGWWHECEGDIPLHLQTYLELETEAERIDTCSMVIPGMLQTADYARVITGFYGINDAVTVDQMVWLRTQRHERLRAGHPQMVDAILIEDLLRRCAADGLIAQLNSLVEDSYLPNTRIRVLPCSAGVHPITGTYVILTLPGNMLDPVMYLEYVGGSFIVEQESAVAATAQRHSVLPALDEEASREFLKTLIATSRGSSLEVV